MAESRQSRGGGSPRRRHATLLLLAALGGALGVGCSATRGRSAAATGGDEASAASGFTLLQINDTYKIEGLRGGRLGGFGRIRALRRALEAEGRPVLVLHAGDFLFPSVMSKYLDGAPMIDALNLLDGSPESDDRLIVTFGNHEFDSAKREILFDRIAQSRFLWLSSNVRVRAEDGAEARPLGERFPQVVDHRLVDLGGVRVGLFGLTLDDQKRPWVEYGFAEAERRATIERVLAELERGGAEFVVALTHQNLGEDEWLAREYGDRIDWIAGGHEHVYVRRTIGATAISKADADGVSAIRIDVRREGDRLVATDRRIDLDGTRPVDPEMAGQVAASLVRLARVVEEKTGADLLDVVATSEQLLEGTEPAIRGRETALGNFLCDTLRERFATDVAFVHGGAVRVNDDVPAGGDLRVYELEGIFYYDDRPVLLALTGRELLDLLRKSVSEADLGHGRFLQVSGLRFRYRVRAGAPPAVDPADVEVGGAVLELDRTYRVATLRYLWRFGSRDGYALFAEGDGGVSPPALAEPEVSWRALTEEAIARLPQRRITTGLDGRIERLAADEPGS